MTATRSRSGPGELTSAEPTEDSLRVGAAAPQRRLRVAQLLASLLVVGLSVLVVVWWVSGETARQPVAVLAADVGQGQVLSDGDLAEALVVADPGVSVMSSDAARGLVGQRALTDLTAGMFVTSDLFSTSADLGVGEWAVGMALAPGAVPSPSLGPGDRVAVFRTIDRAELPRLLRPDNDTNLMLGEATVLEVTELATGEMWVTLRVAAADAESVTAAASADSVRLAQLPLPAAGETP